MTIDQGIFVDTSFFRAVLDLSDDNHARGVKIWQKLDKGKMMLVVTNFVLDEAYTLLRTKAGLHLAVKLHETVFNSPASFVVDRITPLDENLAWDFFSSREWRGLSFTDCTSFVAMGRMGIKKVAAFDEHFEQAGFERVK